MDSPEPMRHLLVHYNEIALKGKNRRFFEQKLVEALRRGLRGLGFERVRRLYGRLLVEFRQEIPWEEARRRLSRIFGVSHFARARPAPLDLEGISANLVQALTPIPAGVRSFAVFTRRPNKSFPLNSMELNRRLGQFIKDRTGWAVSLESPDLPIYVYILQGEAFVTFERCPGPGGLPAGASGKVACLISGGIDSPVAASRMMRRGCTVEFIHFHSYPHTSAASVDKAKQIVDFLLRDRGAARLHLIPFADLQRRIVVECPAPYRVLLYRRFMMRAAEAIARREGALALVTGESLGQVASQTLENLTSIESAVSMPVLRPLVGMDKEEIVEEARGIGTFEISIQPHDDCCGFLMPHNPATRTSPQDLDEAERHFDLESEVAALVGGAEMVEIGPGTEKVSGTFSRS